MHQSDAAWTQEHEAPRGTQLTCRSMIRPELILGQRERCNLRRILVLRSANYVQSWCFLGWIDMTNWNSTNQTNSHFQFWGLLSSIDPTWTCYQCFLRCSNRDLKHKPSFNLLQVMWSVSNCKYLRTHAQTAFLSRASIQIEFQPIILLIHCKEYFLCAISHVCNKDFQL